MQEFKEQYFAGRERMHPELERLAKENKTTLSNNRAFPEIDSEGNKLNFEEISAYKRFLDVVAKVKHYTGVQDLSNPQSLMQLQGMLMQTFQQIIPIQEQHKEQLENMAVDLVIRELEIPKGSFKFDCKFVAMGELDKSKFQEDSQEPSQDDIEEQFGGDNFQGAEFETPNDSFEKEKQKRRFTNALIQGSAKKGHYMFELVRNELNQIHPDFAKMYGIVMSINDLMYWMMPDEEMKQKAGESVNGEEEIDTETDPPTIKVRGILFPILVHELIKGIFDIFGTHGLPDDPKSQQMVMNSTDTLTNEIWDLRLGSFFWERLVNMFPITIFEEGNKHIQHYLFARLSALETEEFFEVFQDVMKGNSEGKKFVEDMVYDIEKDISERAMNETLGEYDFGTDEDEDEGLGLYKDGDEVEWSNNALDELKEYEDDDSLKIWELGDEIYISGSDSEYLIFKNESEALDYAHSRVMEDLEENIDYFNEDFIYSQVDEESAERYFREVYDEMNTSYVEDIESESDSKYENRLVAEMVEAGIIDEEELAGYEFSKENFIEYLTDNQIEDGNGGLDYYEMTFGKEEAMNVIKDNNLIDYSDTSDEAISVDGIAHFISSYDGNTIELPSGYMAYRTN